MTHMTHDMSKNRACNPPVANHQHHQQVVVVVVVAVAVAVAVAAAAAAAAAVAVAVAVPVAGIVVESYYFFITNYC